MKKRILSCFIDESGDFGPYETHSPYYCVSMVLHDQDDDVSDKFADLDEKIENTNFDNHVIHTAPLIRREDYYKYFDVSERKHLYNILYYFSVNMPIKYFCVTMRKSECSDAVEQTAKLSKLITEEIQASYSFWSSFDEIIIYYDYGQIELTRVITSVFNALFSNVEMRRVKPVDYKLFQVADFMCTVEMLNLKAEAKSFSKSELEFFGSTRNFKKNYYKKLQSKRL